MVMSKSIKDLPSIENQALERKPQTSKIYASDGTLLTDLFVDQNRINVSLKDISKNMQKAAVAIEDERFFNHKGVDIAAVIRALFINLKTGQVVEGGSTITQQYVKNTFITSELTMRRKIREALLAYQFEKKYSKRTILEKYLNTVYFGHTAYGVETAALTFFGKHAKELNLNESAFLAGLIRNPSRYSPYNNYDISIKRRNLVLNKMLELELITEEQAKKAKAEKIKLKPLQKEKIPQAPYFVEYVKQQLIDEYGANAVFQGGMRIHTTLDLKMQKAAEEAATAILDQPDDPSVAIVAIDPRSGHIKAMVGGRDFRTEKYNLAVQGKRQPGSAFKVFVLVSALEMGFSPNKIYESSPTTIKLPGEDWEVDNAADGVSYGKISLRQGTIASINGVYARLIMDVGPNNVVNTSYKMGIVSKLHPYPAIALGGLEVGVSPLEMASAYGTIANMGMYYKPFSITKIKSFKGKQIYKGKPLGIPAISQSTAYVTNEILSDVIKRGTGRRAKIARPSAGKTGTTQNYADAWFVGYTPDLVAAVWVGYPEERKPMLNIHGTRVFGGTFPAPIWAYFMNKALEGVPFSNFPKPELDQVKVQTCKDSGLLANPICPNVITEIFLQGIEPTEYCTIHKGIYVPDVIGLTETDATSKIIKAGLTVSIIYKDNPNFTVGQVIDQDPEKDYLVNPDDKVTIFVNSPPTSQIEMPTVIGLTVEQAQKALEGNDFFIKITKQKVDLATQKGIILSQDPLPGTKVEKEAIITLVIGE